MGNKFYLSPEFKKLQKTWNQKLKDSGFEDIENAQFETIKTPHSRYFYSRYTPEEIEESLTYYNQCMDFYWRYSSFKSNREKEIWLLYSEGKSKRKIAELLRSRGMDICHNLVQYYIGRLKKIMHTQSWPSSEMGEHDSSNTTEEKSHLY